MTPARIEALRAEFEAGWAELDSSERPNLDRLESGEYRLAWTRAMFRGWVWAVQHYCEGEA